MEKCGCDICKQLLELRHSLVKKSQWIFGGDGWGWSFITWKVMVAVSSQFWLWMVKEIV